MKASQFRKIAPGFQDAIESSHMSHPDFRAGGKKIFATLNAEETRGMVALTPEQQRVFVAAHPSVFEPASGAWGRQGSTMIELAKADAEVVGEAMTLAWQNAQRRAAPKPRKRGPTAKRPRRNRNDRAAKAD